MCFTGEKPLSLVLELIRNRDILLIFIIIIFSLETKPVSGGKSEGGMLVVKEPKKVLPLCRIWVACFKDFTWTSFHFKLKYSSML